MKMTRKDILWTSKYKGTMKRNVNKIITLFSCEIYKTSFRTLLTFYT